MIKNGMRPVHPGKILLEEFMKPSTSFARDSRDWREKRDTRDGLVWFIWFVWFLSFFEPNQLNKQGLRGSQWVLFCTPS